jgi:uncharacterized protein (TIGR02594 family)
MALQLASPAWFTIALSYLGTREIPGARHNPVILGWWKRLGIAIRDDETPYCAGFVGSVLKEAGLDVTGATASARSFLKVGKKIDEPALGAVVVFWRGKPSGWSGHVGFVAGKDKHGNLMVLGANQKNTVSIAPFSEDRVLGYRWPTGFLPLPQRYDLPVLDSDGRVSTNEA